MWMIESVALGKIEWIDKEIINNIYMGVIIDIGLNDV